MEVERVILDPRCCPHSGRTGGQSGPNDDYLFALAESAGIPGIVGGAQNLTDVRDPPVAVLTPSGAVQDLLEGGLSG